jgi:hypothetical protein
MSSKAPRFRKEHRVRRFVDPAGLHTSKEFTMGQQGQNPNQGGQQSQNDPNQKPGQQQGGGQQKPGQQSQNPGQQGGQQQGGQRQNEQNR